MVVTVKNLQKKIPLKPARISKIVKTILRHEGVAKVDLSVTFVTAQKIRALNRKFLNRDHTTDVLAFDLREEQVAESKRKKKTAEIFGDIIISTDAVRQNARTYQTTCEREIVLYVIHGLLHLLGYDDHRPQDVIRMRDKEAVLLEYLDMG